MHFSKQTKAPAKDLQIFIGAFFDNYTTSSFYYSACKDFFKNSIIFLNPILQTGGKLCLLELEQNIGYNPS